MHYYGTRLSENISRCASATSIGESYVVKDCFFIWNGNAHLLTTHEPGGISAFINHKKGKGAQSVTLKTHGFAS